MNKIIQECSSFELVPSGAICRPKPMLAIKEFIDGKEVLVQPWTSWGFKEKELWDMDLLHENEVSGIWEILMGELKL